ncbi:MAG: radical SAM protein [Candidatus Micrarchaeales archaeon]|jgi:DNA repair photolyase
MPFEIIKQLKSWLAINPIIGCPSECAYCYRQDDNIFWVKEPVQIRTVEETLNNLLNHRFFLPNSTPIAICNMTTDPFFEKPKKFIYELLSKLDDSGYTNSVGLITKQLITKDDIAFLESLSNININVFVTYSEMPKNIEPIGNERRKQSLKNLSDSKIKTILYWRPIIEGQNTDEKRIKEVLDFGEKCADAFVISGLKISPNISASLEKQGVHLVGEFKSDHKKISDGSTSNILNFYKEEDISTPLFRRTSCAVSYLKNISDYNAHWSNPQKNCLDTCPASQKQSCSLAAKPKKEMIEFLLEKMDNRSEFEINENYVGIKGRLTAEELTYLRHNLLFPVSSI